MGIFDFFKSDLENSEHLQNSRISVFARLIMMYPVVYPDLIKDELNIKIDSEDQENFENEIFFIVYRFLSDLVMKDPNMDKYMFGEVVKSISVENYTQSKFLDKESFIYFITKKESEYFSFDPAFVNDELITNFAKVSSDLIGPNNHVMIKNNIIKDFKVIFNKILGLYNSSWEDPKVFLKFTND